MKAPDKNRTVSILHRKVSSSEFEPFHEKRSKCQARDDIYIQIPISIKLLKRKL